jgi:hypothetical protein
VKTFSAMSTPDKSLTKQSYLLKLSVVNHSIHHDSFLIEEQILILKKEASRLQILIDAIEADLLSE